MQTDKRMDERMDGQYALLMHLNTWKYGKGIKKNEGEAAKVCLGEHLQTTEPNNNK